ncbi:hypothetical protein apy_02000 [Aeropyrum pernix]|uniref:Protein apy_02000 n=1 Tax=Aeropyrum pernix TaxID=56636 RepID=A0A401H7Q0_AERPX|nr:nicotinamide mononucleotide deamidase-related protein [Aeropyrum pernix]GBF08475.1 hypothetical protein apy_02000 [Aeropyrum pernix]
MEEHPRAWIISVGNELLIGRTINTNAAWLGSRLTLLGFEVERVVTVPDRVEDIAEEVGRALGRARVVITTGGLGPTYDDVTLQGVAMALGRGLKLHPGALEMVRRFYSKRGLGLTEDRVKMAMLPEGAEPLENPVGAAPGAVVEARGSLVASLPGVPSEMEAMFEKALRPLLEEIAPPGAVVECGIAVVGVPESSLAPYIKEASRVSPRVYVKSHPQGSEIGKPLVRVRVLARASTLEEARAEALKALEKVRRGVEELGGSISEEDSC